MLLLAAHRVGVSKKNNRKHRRQEFPDEGKQRLPAKPSVRVYLKHSGHRKNRPPATFATDGEPG
jgi:hypothetical protein